MLDSFFNILGVVAMFAPLIIILWFANLGQKMREQDIPHMAPVVVAYLLLILVYVFLLLFGLLALLVDVGVRNNPQMMQNVTTVGGANPFDLVTSWAWLSWGLIIPSAIGLLLMLKPVRRLVARFTKLDPGHPVHTVALGLTMMPLVLLAFTLSVGLGTLAAQMTDESARSGSPPVTLGALWAQTAMFLLAALVGVGWLSRRSFGATLARLGIVKPTLREVLIGIGAALALVPAVMLLEALFRNFGLGVSQDVESLTEALTGPLFSTPLGIISIGLAAAIGEEPLFRGAAQPRFGLLITATLFALVHSQYGISLATLIVFGLGLVLGILRMRFNTTTSIITHAVYNSSLGVLFVLAQSALK